MNTTQPDHGTKHPGLMVLCGALLATSILAAQDIVIEPRAVFGYGGCNTLAMAPDGQHFLTAGRFGAFLWELDSGRVIARFQDTGKEQWYWRIAVSPDGKRLVGAGRYWDWEPVKSRAYVHLWDLTTGDLVHKLESPHWADARHSYETSVASGCWAQDTPQWAASESFAPKSGCE